MGNLKEEGTEWLKEHYGSAVVGSELFEGLGIFSLAGYYLTNYCGRELEQLKEDMSEGLVSELHGLSVTTILELVLE